MMLQLIALSNATISGATWITANNSGDDATVTHDGYVNDIDTYLDAVPGTSIEDSTNDSKKNQIDGTYEKKVNESSSNPSSIAGYGISNEDNTIILDHNNSDF